MISKWTAHLKDQSEITRFKSSLEGSRTVLDRLKAIIEESERMMEATEVDPKSYDNPSWSHKQAFYNGAKSQLKLIRKLLENDPS